MSFLHDSESESDEDEVDTAMKQTSFVWMGSDRFDVIVCWIQEWVGIGLKNKSIIVITLLRMTWIIMTTLNMVGINYNDTTYNDITYNDIVKNYKPA